MSKKYWYNDKKGKLQYGLSIWQTLQRDHGLREIKREDIECNVFGMAQHAHETIGLAFHGEEPEFYDIMIRITSDDPHTEVAEWEDLTRSEAEDICFVLKKKYNLEAEWL